MAVHFTTSADEARRELADAPSPVVVVPIHNAHDDVMACIDSLIEHTPPEFSILLMDDAGRDQRFQSVLRRAADGFVHRVVILTNGENLGFVRTCNRAFDCVPGRDVVLVNSDVVVGPEWLGRLTAAATSDDAIATATTLTNHGTILSVPSRNTPVNQLPKGLTPAQAARRVAAHAARTYPTIPTAIGHCVYFRRPALELVGGFDEAFSPGYGEEVDFSQRATRFGFRHVCADDVFTYHRGGASFRDADVRLRQLRNDEIVGSRHPWYHDWVNVAATDLRSPLADAIARAQRSLLGLHVAVDALCLGPDRMGTQEIVVNTIRALAERKEITRLVAFVPMQPPGYVAELRDELRDVEFIGTNPFLGLPERVVDVIYRPYQVREIIDVDFLHRAAERFVINQLDTIAYCNPAYFASFDAWTSYRDVTKLALELADGVAFLSESGLHAARAEGLIGVGGLTSVVHCGQSAIDPTVEPTPPAGLSPLHEGFLLCLGASYRHKGRAFALQVWDELRRRGWPGQIVLAGATPPHGNSLSDEAELLLVWPDRRADVHVVGSVSDAEKRWLYDRAALVLYPSVTEGFGLIPFEAAALGVPTLATRRGSMRETLPDDVPALDSFDVSAAADAAWALLHDETAAKRSVESMCRRGADFSWERTAEALIELFDATLLRPRRRVLVIEGERELPTGLASNAQRRQLAGRTTSLERLVQGVIARPNLKQRLSPDGSRRQRYARQAISQVRARDTERR